MGSKFVNWCIENRKINLVISIPLIIIGVGVILLIFAIIGYINYNNSKNSKIVSIMESKTGNSSIIKWSIKHRWALFIWGVLLVAFGVGVILICFSLIGFLYRPDPSYKWYISQLKHELDLNQQKNLKMIELQKTENTLNNKSSQTGNFVDDHPILAGLGAIIGHNIVSNKMKEKEEREKKLIKEVEELKETIKNKR
jgi:uncharacterized membrane protein